VTVSPRVSANCSLAHKKCVNNTGNCLYQHLLVHNNTYRWLLHTRCGFYTCIYWKSNTPGVESTTHF